MSRLNRLRQNYEFQEVYAGQRIFSKSFILFFLPAKDISFGVVASSKTFGKAVQRNFAKRRMRELIRFGNKSKALKTGKYVLVGRRNIIEAKFKDLQGEFLECLRK